jgi:hypothetical protein
MAADQASMPSEVLALLHHVELNDAGWPGRTARQLVLAHLWTNEPCAADGVGQSIRTAFRIDVDEALLRAQLAQLATEGAVIELPGGDVKLAEDTRRDLNAEIARVSILEDGAKERFVDTIRRHDIANDADEAWTIFCERFIMPLVRDLGARTYELITSSPAAAAEQIAGLAQLIDPLTGAFGERFRDAALEFLDPSVPEVRQFVLRRLDACFAMHAQSLDEDTLAAIAAPATTAPELHIFLDTNFVFSVLQLHDNPENEVAERLAALIPAIAQHVRVKLYVLPITIDEARHVLAAQIHNLSGLRMTRNLAQGALEVTFSGLASRYFQEASKSEAELTPEAFFSPYEQNLMTFLRQKGVELFNADMAPLRMDQAVIDDLHDQQDFQERTRDEGAKRYETNLHDMVLWHFASRKRPAVVESPIDAKEWILTLDWGFIGFDRHKRRAVSGLPLCIPPATILQLLQFWVPRERAIDEAIVSAIRLPLMFIGHDAETEQVSTRILKRISRYENASDLSPASVAQVLTNQALRQRIAAAPNEEAEDELIERAFIDQVRQLEEQLAQQQSAAQQDTDAARLDRERLERELKEVRETLASSREEIERTRDHEATVAAKAEATATDVAQLKGDLAAAQKELSDARRRRSRNQCIARFFGVLVIAVAVDVAALHFLRPALDGPLAWLLSSAGGLLIVVSLLPHIVPRAARAQVSPWRGRLRSFRARVVAGAVALALGVLGNALWSALQKK